MGLRIRRSNRPFRSMGVEPAVWTSIGAPGTGVSFGQSAEGNGRYLLGTAIVIAISVVLLLTA